MSNEVKPPIQSEGWKQWSQNVKESLEKLDKKIDKLEDKITKHREEALVEVTTLKAKAGIFGLIAGLIASAVMSIVVGLFVYQLTVGSGGKPSPLPFTNPPVSKSGSVGQVLPPRDNEEVFSVKGDISS